VVVRLYAIGGVKGKSGRENGAIVYNCIQRIFSR